MTEEVRKLYRNSSDKKIAGVCSGLAKFLGLDPTIVRIVALLALIFGGIGFWAYIIIWIIAPEKPLGM